MPQPPNQTSPLAAPITSLWGVGDERAKLLARLEIFTIEDLLLHRPRRYEDRRKFLAIRDLQLKEAATVRGKIVAAGVKRFKGGRRAMFECVLDDGTAMLHCRWWQAQPWMEEWYAVGREFLVFGKPDSLRPRNMDHPETERIEEDDDEAIHVNRIVPIHPLTEGLTARVMRSLVWRALEKFEAQIPEPTPALDLNFFPTRANAVRMIHFPEELPDVEIARQRLALDEFVALQIQIQLRRKKFEASAKGLPCRGDNRLIKPFLAKLGFKLTEAQTRVLREIRADMGGQPSPKGFGSAGAHPMRRLLQGDVGSGKTAVAACAALMALESGFNVALMSPTEILAEQHFRNFTKWLEPLGVRVEMQTGSHRSKEQGARSKAGAAKSLLLTPCSLTVGTHALLTGGFDLPKLGLVIIDEQHKIGRAHV